MDYAKLKTEIKEIADIAGQLPEAFREQCFAILLKRLLEEDSAANKPSPVPVLVPALAPEPPAPVSPTEALPLTGVLRAFMQRTGAMKDELERVIFFDGKEVHFLREPSHNKLATGQGEWALLLALKNAVVNNEFSTDPEDVRSICQEKGFYDLANFTKTLKREPCRSYFKQPLQSQGPRQPLTNEGQTALAELVRALGTQQ